MIKLSRDNEDLRDTVFWEIFGNCITMNDEAAARRYREEEIRHHRRVPTIYILGTGKCIRSGMNDPRHDRQVREMFDRDEEYLIFGQPEENVPQDLNDSIENMQALLRTCEELGTLQSQYEAHQTTFNSIPNTLAEDIREVEAIIKEYNLRQALIQNESYHYNNDAPPRAVAAALALAREVENDVNDYSRRRLREDDLDEADVNSSSGRHLRRRMNE